MMYCLTLIWLTKDLKMRKSIYVLMFVFCLGFGSNAIAHPEFVLLKDEPSLQSFLEAKHENKELSVTIRFYGKWFLSSENIDLLKAVFVKNKVTALTFELAKEKGELVDAQSLEWALSLLVHLNDLKHFSVCGADVDSIWSLLGFFSSLNPNLDRLSITDSIFTDLDSEQLVSVLPMFEKLNVIDLTGNDLTNGSAKFFAETFAKLPVLRRVNLGNNQIEDKKSFAQVIARSIRSPRNFDLSFPEMYEDGVANYEKEILRTQWDVEWRQSW